MEVRHKETINKFYQKTERKGNIWRLRFNGGGHVKNDFNVEGCLDFG
jgi:hypothetical protein